MTNPTTQCRGWIGESQPEVEWHTPGWVKPGGRHFVQQSNTSATVGTVLSFVNCGLPAGFTCEEVNK
jgi:hypothetical protein